METSRIKSLNLTLNDLGMFRKIGVSELVLEWAKIRRVTDAEACEHLHRRADTMRPIDGILFPYLDPATGKPNSYRVRLDVPFRDDKGKTVKYLASAMDRAHLYFPYSFRDWPEWPVILVEAEKSVLAILSWAQQNTAKIIPVAMGGCWGFRGKIWKELQPDGSYEPQKGVLPDLDLLKGRRVYIMLDANVAIRSDVWRAELDLASELRSRDCDVMESAGLADVRTFANCSGPMPIKSSGPFTPSICGRRQISSGHSTRSLQSARILHASSTYAL